jgi:hypothetical protein
MTQKLHIFQITTELTEAAVYNPVLLQPQNFISFVIEKFDFQCCALYNDFNDGMLLLVSSHLRSLLSLWTASVI